jgi:hypothetical protein
MSNFQAINANRIQMGQQSGTCLISPYPSNERIKGQINVVDKEAQPVITYTDSTNTIDFHNKPVVNFTGGGGGGGGDAFLAGGTGLVTPQEFTGFNRFDNDTQFADGLSFSDNGIDINGRIHASASALHLQTNNVLDTISMKLAPAGSTNTLELKQDPGSPTQNALFIQQDSTSSTLDKVLTNSTQDLGVIVDAVEVSPNVFTASNTFTSNTTTNGVNNIGLITTTNQSTTNEHTVGGVLTANGSFNCRDITVTAGYSINATGVGSFIRAGESVVCGAGHMFYVGPNKLKSTDLDDSLDLVRQLNSYLTISGQIQGDSIISNGNITTLSGGNVLVDGLVQSVGDIITTGGNVEARGGSLFLRSSTAGMIDDASRDLLIQANSDGNKIYFGLGSGTNKALKLDIFGTRARLQLYDYTTTPGTYYDVGQNPADIAGIIALLQNTSLTFNPTTTLISQGIFSHSGTTCNLINGTGNGTLNIGTASSTDAVLIDAQTTFREDVAVATTKDIFSPDLVGGTRGVIDVSSGCVDRTLSSWEPTNTTITPVSGYTNQITNLFDASFVRVRFGTNHFISMRGGFRVTPTVPPTVPTPTFPSGNFTIANMGSTYAPSNNMYFSYQKQPGVPPGFINLTPTGDFILIGLDGTETEIYLGGIQYFKN